MEIEKERFGNRYERAVEDEIIDIDISRAVAKALIKEHNSGKADINYVMEARWDLTACAPKTLEGVLFMRWAQTDVWASQWRGWDDFCNHNYDGSVIPDYYSGKKLSRQASNMNEDKILGDFAKFMENYENSIPSLENLGAAVKQNKICLAEEIFEAIMTNNSLPRETQMEACRIIDSTGSEGNGR
jgi:hypothetical protein